MMDGDSQQTSNSSSQVRQVIAKWRDAVNSGSVERVLDLVTDDLEIMPPGQPAVSGSEAHAFLRNFIGQFDAKVSPFENEEIIVCDNWAVQRFTYQVRLTPREGGDPIMEQGDGIHMFRQDSPGSWRLAKDISTSF